MRLTKLLRLHSIRLQLMAAYLLALLLAAGVVALTFFFLFVWYEDASIRKGLTHQAKWIAETLQFNDAGQPVAIDPDRNAMWIYSGMSHDLKYAVLDEAGTVLFASDSEWRRVLPPVNLRADLAPVLRIDLDGLPLDMLTMPVQRKGAKFYIQVARSDRINQLARRAIGYPVLKTALWGGVAALLLLFLVVYLTLRRSLRPLRVASEAAARIEPGNLSARLDTAELPTELTPLVDAFNNALNRLQQGYRVQQEFLAGAAHELKTPLALIRAQIELDGAADRVALLSDVDMMARQVHQLLHLAEVSEAHNYVIEPISLMAVASEITGYLGRLAAMRQVSLRILSSDGEGAVVEADRSATFVLLKNLVENAIRHSPPGGTVTVALEEDRLYVEDGGQGIAADDMPKLYTRFWRGANRRDDGAGLGLAICRQIATTHGWTIDASNVSPGARFTVTFLQK